MHYQHLNVVAIDDDDVDLLLLGRYLDEVPGHRVDLRTASSRDEALVAIEHHNPDIVLVDYQLGAQTGLDAIADIRRQGYERPIVMLTGMGHEELAADAFKSGVADYIPKSHLSAASLGRSIDNALEKHRLQQAVEAHQRELQNANRDLTRRNEEVRNFYHTLSHEMKTPLTSAREFVSIMLEGLAGPLTEEQQEYLRYAKESCDQLVRHLGDLLDVARLETGKLRIETKEAQVEPMIDLVLASKRIAARQAGVSLSKEIAPNLRPVVVDPQRIGQVLTNLVDNAIKFTDGGGSITVRAEPGSQWEDQLSVAVVDTGRGIPEDKLERIFDRLCQVVESDAHEQQGLGLGLNICKELIALHQGRIWAESTPGQGSTISFSLPVAATPC